MNPVIRKIRAPSPPSTLRQKLRNLLMVSCVSLVSTPFVAAAAEPVPTVSLPPAVGFPFDTASINLAKFGYNEKEFFISGTAQAYTNNGTLGNDGVWNVTPGATTPYTTRILVRKPIDPGKFNGIVVVEWLNVTGGIDAAAEWDYDHVELLRKGYAWVGVSAQYVGTSFLKYWNSTRYAAISQPGDSWSYDIFSQAGAAVLQGNPKPLGDLTPYVRQVLAVGESQSAFRLFTYYNAIQPVSHVFQGFLIHSTGSGSALSQSFAGGQGAATIPAPPGVPATPDITEPPTAFIRGDLAQPVLFLNTETDIGILGAGFSVHNQPDSHVFRMWEIAGTAHADNYLLEQSFADAARSGLPGTINCGDPPNNNGPHTFAARAAIRALAEWTELPSLTPSIGPRFSVQIVTSPQVAAVIARNPRNGNALGGIRYPQVSVPIETLTGIRPPGALAANSNCVLFGATNPWDNNSDAWDGRAGFDPTPNPEPSLVNLYGTKKNYLGLYAAAEAQSVAHGFLLPEDVHEVLGLAKAYSVPNGTAANAAILPNP